jgi:phosphoglycolate phosphatase-like HAD superfamily hydrolase
MRDRILRKLVPGDDDVRFERRFADLCKFLGLDKVESELFMLMYVRTATVFDDLPVAEENSDRPIYYSMSIDRSYPEVLKALQRRGCRLAVVSNKLHTATEKLCRHFFSDTITVAIGENEAAGIRKKPAPDTVFEALRKLGASPAGAVYVGDSEVDLQTASNAGLPCISVLWGFRDRKFLTANGATTFVDTPQELL